VFLLITVMIDAMGIGLILPVMPGLIEEVSGRGLSGAAIWGGILATAFAAMQFLFAPLLGALSDTYGRKPVLIWALAIMVIDYAVMGLTHSLVMLLIARLLGGMASATHSTAFAAMADLSPKEKRATGFGLIGASFGLGFVLGPTIGGVLGEFGTRAPFWMAAGLAAFNVIFGLLAFPETTTEATRRPFNRREANPFGAFKTLSREPGLRRGFAIMFLYHTAFGVYPSVWAFFTEARFGWSPALTGISLGVFGISFAFVQGGLIRILLKYLGEPGVVKFGLVMAALAFLTIALTPWGMVVLAMTPLAALGGAFAPALQGMMSKVIADDRQGALQGVLSSTAALAMAVSPLLMNSVFAHFTKPQMDAQFAGAPFVVSLLLVLAALVLFTTRNNDRFS
jgi:DHA1 family tetracycline resistance protein-like MFS transporter